MFCGTPCMFCAIQLGIPERTVLYYYHYSFIQVGKHFVQKTTPGLVRWWQVLLIDSNRFLPELRQLRCPTLQTLSPAPAHSSGPVRTKFAPKLTTRWPENTGEHNYKTPESTELIDRLSSVSKIRPNMFVTGSQNYSLYAGRLCFRVLLSETITMSQRSVKEYFDSLSCANIGLRI